MIQATLSDSNYPDAKSLLEWDDERAAEFAAAEKNKKKKKEKKWAGGDLNSGPPPCQGGILTRLDHRPDIQ